jgi:hypothetical protein
MAWFLNNQNSGSAEAAMHFAYDAKELDTTYFMYDDLDRQQVIAEIEQRGTRSILCSVVVVEGRVPNKDIVNVEIYPPFPDVINIDVLDFLRMAMTAANSEAA